MVSNMSRVITTRFTTPELEQICLTAQQNNMNVSEYIRLSVRKMTQYYQKMENNK